MNDDITLFEYIRRVEDKLIETKIENGIEVKYDTAFGLNDGELGAYFKHNGKWVYANAVVKLALAMNLPESNFNQFKKNIGA